MSNLVSKTYRMQRIQDLIENLKQTTAFDEIAALGQAEHDWLFANYPRSAGTFISNEYIPAIESAFPASQGEQLAPTEFWHKVKGKWVKRHRVVQSLKPTVEEWDERNLPTKQAGSTKANHKLPLRPQPLIDKAVELLDCDHWASLTAGLILLTGRRPTEIVWSAHFEPSSLYTVWFSGQLKQGSEEDEDEGAVDSPVSSARFEIPVLIEAGKVLDAFERLGRCDRVARIIRSKPDARSAASANAEINDAVREHYRGLINAPPNRNGLKLLSCRHLRAAYGKIAEYFYCPPTAEPIFFVGKILGHTTHSYTAESLATTIHYYTYYIASHTGKRMGDIGVRLGMPGVKTLYDDADDAELTQRSTSAQPRVAVPISTDSSTSVPSSFEFPSSAETATQVAPGTSTTVKTVKASRGSKSHTSIISRPLRGFSADFKRFKQLEKNLGTVYEPETFAKVLELARWGYEAQTLLEKRGLEQTLDTLDAVLSRAMTTETVTAVEKSTASSGQLGVSSLIPTNEAVVVSKTEPEVTSQLNAQSSIPSGGQSAIERGEPSSVPVNAQLLDERPSERVNEPPDAQQPLSEMELAWRAIAQLTQTVLPLTQAVHQLTEQLSSTTAQTTTQSSVASTGIEVATRSQIETTGEQKLSRKRGRAASAASEAKVNAVIDQIIAYNQERPHEEKWRISINGLKQLLTCSQDVIVRVMQQRQIEQYNLDNGLGSHHNRRHHLDISQVFGS